MDFNESQNNGQNAGGEGQPNTQIPSGQDFVNSQYTNNPYTDAQNASGQYTGNPYTDGQNAAGQYTGNPYAGAQNASGQYTNNQYGGSQYANTQYSAPQYTGQPPYGEAPYGAPYGYIPQPQANPNNGFAIASLICGIAGILLCCCYGAGAVVGIVGIVLAVMSKKQNAEKMSGMAIAGLVCGIIGVIFSAIWIIYYIFYGAAYSTYLLSDYFY